MSRNPLDPIGPHDFGPLGREFQTIMLERTKVAAMEKIGPQFAHDLDLRLHTDFLTDDVVLVFTSFVMSHQDGTDEKTVMGTATFEPYKYRAWWVVASGALFAAGLALAALNAHLAAAIAIIAAWAVPLSYLAIQPKTIKARRPFTVRATRWNRFPESTYIFPPNLGRPVVQVVAEVVPPEDEDDEENE